jgi:hypothetical protein
MADRMTSGYGFRAHAMTMWSSRGIGGAVVCALSGTLALTACTPTGPGPASPSGHPSHTRATGHGSGHPRAAGCVTTIHGVMYGPGRLLPTWLPAGFRRSAATQAGLAMPTENYTLATSRPNPPRIEVGFANDPRPFARFTGRRPASKYPTIEGHRGRLQYGPATARLISVYWKPDGLHLLNVTGYRVPAAEVVTVAKNVWFDPPGLVRLPVSPGRVVTKRAAISMAESAIDFAAEHSIAKLTSWAEVAAMLQAGHAAADLSSVPGAFASERWQAIWTVLLTDTTGGATAVVLINAATGQPVVTVPAARQPAWFSALTDRSRIAVHRCQGGSLARLPFGVLTRNEEAFAVTSGAPHPISGAEHARATIQLKLTTVPALNRVASGIYGGCVQQSCSIEELVWVIVTTVRANPGSTVACLPSWADSAPGYRPSQVKQYFWVSVPGNYGVYCRRLPASIMRLTDLSPPSSRG